MNWQASIEKTVTGLGYDVVACERSAAGLLRVYIDKLPEAAAAGEIISVDDCERVTRQLQYVLEVENVLYERLEVSSPGVDRPLNKPADYARFAGSEVQITLKAPFQGRKKYKGLLEANGEGWRLIFADDKKVEQALDFSLEEVREARLVPELTFKGRNAAGPAGAAKAPGKGAAKKTAKRSNAKARQVTDEVAAADETTRVDERSDT
jgi:ribosome maturation factor RimP